ncbi:helix-turn-helix domain-containing protein [Borrelia hermsii]|uniref:helix-turn-helix domain-containing protein n=1 Tax=Borrelia hermsii TaxID=140 RepID=UPI0005D92C6B|nr:helix-turn-helix domain-containing protein [Borrelia hermsii]AJW73157.1 membrane protein [Borrelia hermsii CC1]UCP01364.1 helix-turn-helix domain-containing protein [Borrelia hermsii]UEQ06991.1 helix-turn-helix domain-containing protein [Borrelia hermsii]
MERNNFIRFGDFLKKTRIDKGLTLEMISDDIRISVKYLKALEDSNIESFPNEVLAVGFLRTYSEYLGVDIWYVSSLFKEYKRRLNSSYIGIKTDDQNGNSNFVNEGRLGSKYFDILKIDFSRVIKILVGVMSAILLILLISNFSGFKQFLGRIFKVNHATRRAPEMHEVFFDKESFWNVALGDGDFLSLVHGNSIAKYKVSFVNDDLVITNDFQNGRYVFSLGKSREIDLNDNIKVKIVYDNCSQGKVRKAHVSLESFMFNVEYVLETNLSSRFNVLNWGFEVNGPKSRVINEYPTVYSSQDISNIDLVIRFLNDTFLRYADDDNLYGKSLFVSKGVPLSLNFKRSLILFLSRLSDVNIVLQGKDITSILRNYKREIMAVQFFWLKTPGGFDLKVSEVY